MAGTDVLQSPRIGSGQARCLATAEFRGDPADAGELVEQVVQRIAAVTGTLDREALPGGYGVRLVAASGAVLRVLLGVPADPAAGSPGTHTVSVFVEDPGPLDRPQLERVLAAVERLPFTALEMRELREQMPLTAGLPDHLPPGCLAGVAPVLTVHHMTDFLVMVEAIRRMGVPPDAITVIDKQYRYRHRDRVDSHLRGQGIAVHPWTNLATALAGHVARARRAGRAGLLVDDGGYTLPVLMDARPDLVPAFRGLVEQTMSGIVKLERFGERLPLPIFSVAQSRLKSTVEAYGIADAAVRNVLALLPQEKFEGQPALVLGYGRIGEQVADVLRARRMRVAVFDRQIVRLVAAHERGFLTSRSLIRLLESHRPLLVVGSTGRPSLRGEHARALRRDCYLVSTTSRNYEFALDELAEEAVEVRPGGTVGSRLHLRNGTTATVLADGFPVNFHHAESLPNKHADLILAALLVGAATLAAPGHGFAAGHNVAATDRVLESCGLLERYYDRFGPGAGSAPATR
jgi:adenosylhomocysteinase